jgi:hypothetical protein
MFATNSNAHKLRKNASGSAQIHVLRGYLILLAALFLHIISGYTIPKRSVEYNVKDTISSHLVNSKNYESNLYISAQNGCCTIYSYGMDRSKAILSTGGSCALQPQPRIHISLLNNITNTHVRRLTPIASSHSKSHSGGRASVFFAGQHRIVSRPSPSPLHLRGGNGRDGDAAAADAGSSAAAAAAPADSFGEPGGAFTASLSSRRATAEDTTDEVLPTFAHRRRLASKHTSTGSSTRRQEDQSPHLMR